MNIDLHCHTAEWSGCCHTPAVEMLRTARERGLDGVVVTDHRHHLTEDERDALERTCKAAYKALGCRDYGRIDVRMRDGVVYILDVNPNADISSDASLACAAELAGYSYGETGSRIVRLAADRHPVWGKSLS